MPAYISRRTPSRNFDTSIRVDNPREFGSFLKPPPPNLPRGEQPATFVQFPADDGAEMSGVGFFTNAQSILAWANKALNSNAAAKLSNVFPDADENARPIFPGEQHAVGVCNGKPCRASFTGPGTRVAERLRRNPRGKQYPWMSGDPPRNYTDLISRRHDISYGLSADAAAIREADNRMLADLRRAKQQKLDSKFNINPALAGIAAKVKAEDYGLLSKSAFVTGRPPSSSDRGLFRRELSKMDQYGFGDGRVKRISGDSLKRLNMMFDITDKPLIPGGPTPTEPKQLFDRDLDPKKAIDPEIRGTGVPPADILRQRIQRNRGRAAGVAANILVRSMKRRRRRRRAGKKQPNKRVRARASVARKPRRPHTGGAGPAFASRRSRAADIAAKKIINILKAHRRRK